MDSTIQVVPVRRAQAADLAGALRGYIEQNFDQHAAQFAQDAATAGALRERAVSALAAPPRAALAPLAAYYAQVGQIAAKFPAEIGVPLVWSSSLGYATAPVQSHSLQFDRINVGYNVGAKYTQWAADAADGIAGAGGADSSAAAGAPDIKAAYKHMRAAAGAFQHVLTQDLPALPHAPPIGLDEPTLRCLVAVSLAQAQELFWAKARADEVKASLLARLAEAAADLYEEARVQADRTSAVTAELVVHIRAKAAHFAAVAQFRQAQDSLERGEYGEEVARLRRALDIVREGLRDHTQNPAGSLLAPRVAANLVALRDKVQTDLANSERDNDLIYLRQVPTRLAPIAKSVVAQPDVPAELLQPPAAQLFALLLPFNVAQAPLAYKERLDKYVQTYFLDELQKLSAAAQARLDELDLPAALDAVERPHAIPGSLLEAHRELAQSGGADLLKRSAGELEKYAQSSVDRLRAAGAALERARNAVPEGATIRGYPELASEQRELMGFAENAMASDKVVHERIASCEHLLGVLQRGRGAISEFLPRVVPEASGAAAADAAVHFQQAQDLRLAVNHLLGAIARRRELQDQIRAKAGAVDLSASILEYVRAHPDIQQPRDLEPVYTKALGVFNDELNTLRTEKADTQRHLDALNARYAAFAAELRQRSRAAGARANAVSALQHAAHQYGEVVGNLEEGRKFYNSLAARIGAFEGNVQEYISEAAAASPPPAAAPRASTPVHVVPEFPSADARGLAFDHDNSSSESVNAEPPAAPVAAPPTPGAWRPGMPIKFG